MFGFGHGSPHHARKHHHHHRGCSAGRTSDDTSVDDTSAMRAPQLGGHPFPSPSRIAPVKSVSSPYEIANSVATTAVEADSRGVSTCRLYQEYGNFYSTHTCTPFCVLFNFTAGDYSKAFSLYTAAVELFFENIKCEMYDVNLLYCTCHCSFATS